MKKQFTKEDLEFGNVVKLRNGILCLIHPIRNYSRPLIECLMDGNIEEEDIHLRDLITGSYTSFLERYHNNLKNRTIEEYDIVEVYKNYTLKEKLWERKEKPQLTEDEKAILRNIPEKWNWIARDEDGDLYVYETKPYLKDEHDYWDFDGFYDDLNVFNHLFTFIKWEDEKPYYIPDLLEE